MTGFEPRFYAREDVAHLNSPLILRTDQDPKIRRDLFGNSIARIVTRLPKDVSNPRDNRGLMQTAFAAHKSKTFLGDIPFHLTAMYHLGLYYALIVDPKMAMGVPYNRVVPTTSDTPTKTFFMDIETDNSERNPNKQYWASPATQPMTMMSDIDTFNHDQSFQRDTLFSFAWHSIVKSPKIREETYALGDNIKRVIPWVVNLFPTEREMLDAWLVHFDERDPDLMTGWNGFFDYGYTISRMQALGMDYPKLSPVGRVRLAKESDITGRSILDLLNCYRKYTFFGGMKDSYALDNVGVEEIKYAKIKHNDRVGQFWKRDPTGCLFYNARDTDMIYTLDEAMRLLEYYDYLRKEAGVMFEDTMYTGKIIDADQIRAGISRGIALNTKVRYAKADTKEMIEGAFVFPPTVGRHEIVLGLDVKGLYPSIICMLNISPETKVDRDLYAVELLRQKYIRAYNDVYYMRPSERESFARDRLKYMMRKRDEVREMALDSLEASEREKKKGNRDLEEKYKRLYRSYDLRQKYEKGKINTWYGVSAHNGARLYDPTGENGEATTITGQYVVKFIAAQVTSKELHDHVLKVVGIETRLKVLYGDTDSVYLNGFPPGITGSQVQECARVIGEFITKKFDLILKECNAEDQWLKVRVEEIYKTFFMTVLKTKKKDKKGDEIEGAKKRYAGVEWFKWQETRIGGTWIETNKFKVVGFEGRRSNTAKIGRKTQKQVIEMICRSDNLAKTKLDVGVLVNKVQNDILAGKVPIEDVWVATAGSKEVWQYYKLKENGKKSTPPIHVRALEWSQEFLNSALDIFDKIPWIYVQGIVGKVNGLLPRPTDVIALDQPEWVEKHHILVDWKKMYDTQVKEKLVSVFAGIGWDYGEVLTGKSTPNLAARFGGVKK